MHHSTRNLFRLTGSRALLASLLFVCFPAWFPVPGAGLFASPTKSPASANSSGGVFIQKLNRGEIISLDTKPGAHTWWFRADPINPARAGLPPEGTAGRSPVDQPPSGWQAVQVPRNLVSAKLVSDGRTEVWYRKAFIAPADGRWSAAIRLGQISDRDRVYLNGSIIASTGVWDSPLPQGYDRHRIYDLPPSLLRPGKVNVLLVRSKGYFRDVAGIYRDHTSVGPARLLQRQFYLENIQTLTVLAFYLAVALYFLFLFVRRRRERANLYFGMMLIALIIYQFMRTQIKYELNFDFQTFKRTEYLALCALAPLLYHFIRAYFRDLPAPRFTRWWDRGMLVIHLIPVTVAGVVIFSSNTALWWDMTRYLLQPTWLFYVVSILAIITIRIFQKDTDAMIMAGGILIFMAGVVIDILDSRNELNIPHMVPYAFIMLILSLALILANRFVRLHNETDRLNVDIGRKAEAFHRFVPTQFLELLGKDDVSEIHLGDFSKLNLCVLFSDLRSFTNLSEAMSVEDNFRFLNSYLQRMAPWIEKNGGFVDKFIGDAVMALFAGRDGDKLSPVDRAFAAAVDMKRELVLYNEHRTAKEYPPIDFGISLHHGDVMLGTVGSRRRLDTTVIGNTVNLAARLESLTRYYGTSILTTRDTLDRMLKPSEHVREIDNIVVKGKTEPTVVCELFNTDRKEIRDLKHETMDDLREGMELYRARDFRAAADVFKKIAERNPADRIPGIYIKRCEKLERNPPTENWNGAVRLLHK